MKQSRRWLMPLFIIASLIALGLALMPSPIPVSSAEAVLGPFVESVTEEGRTRLRDTYTVSAPIAGYLQRIRPEPGDEVEAGQILFRMEPLPAPALDARSLEQARENLAAARSRQQSARANLETVEADARFSESEYQRYRELHQRNLVSTTEMERARSNRDRQIAARRAAEYAIEVAGFEAESARLVLETASGQRSAESQPELEIRSPIDGLVLRVQRCCEGTINAGDPVLDVGSLKDLEIEVNLLSIAAVRVSPGMRVLLSGWGGDAILEGRVRRIDPAGFTRVSALGVEEQRVAVIVDFTDPQTAWKELGVGYRVEAEFLLWEGEEVLKIPTSALFRSDGQWAVYVVEDGRARLRPVERGRTSGLVSQIVDGLDPGAVIVTHPGDQIRENARVQPD